MKFLRSKKGVNIFPVIMGAILMAIILIILIFALQKISRNAEEQALSSKCRSSVLAYAKLKNMPTPTFISGGVAKQSEIECPTQYITIPKEKPNDQRKRIANAMAQCWGNFGEGKYVLFREGTKFCHICTVMDFEDKSTLLPGLPFYMMTQRMPFKRDGRYLTYFEFINKKIPEQKYVDAMKKQDISNIAGSVKYAVIFTYFKKETKGFWERLFYGTLIAVGTGLAVGFVIVTAGAGSAVLIGGGVGAATFVMGAIGAATASDTVPQASLVLTPYKPETIKKIGCKELPVSQIDKRFR